MYPGPPRQSQRFPAAFPRPRRVFAEHSRSPAKVTDLTEIVTKSLPAISETWGPLRGSVIPCRVLRMDHHQQVTKQLVEARKQGRGPSTALRMSLGSCFRGFVHLYATTAYTTWAAPPVIVAQCRRRQRQAPNREQQGGSDMEDDSPNDSYILAPTSHQRSDHPG